MIYLGYSIFVFAVIQLMIACVNLVFRQSIVGKANGFNRQVSVLIPARNEEKNIGNLLSDLMKHHDQHLEIIVFNDLSTDKTAEIVAGFSAKDARIKLLNSINLPAGWLGKNFACDALSKAAKGDYLLFLDADVRVNADVISNAGGFAEKYNLGLLSIFPTQIMMTLGEKISVPNMNYILLSLLPLIFVRKSGFSSLAAANGQWMLFEASIYRQFMPHAALKANKVEDIAIVRHFKQKSIAVACLTGDDAISCRMYQGYGEAVHGFSKNVINFFGNSVLVAILFWLITTFGFLVVFFALSTSMLMAYLGIILLTRSIISIISKQPVVANLLLLIPQQLTLGLFVYTAIINNLKKEYQWKDRNIL